jgi:tetratricopeptide (TPR) repeat protein
VADGTALLEGAVALSESINLRVAESNSLVLLGEVYLLGGRHDDAQVAGTRALAMARGRGQRGDEACALHLLGEATANRKGDAEEVERHLQAAVDLAEELAMKPLVARCRLTLARSYRRAGDGDRADRELKAAASQFRRLGMRFWLARAEAQGPSRDAAPSAGRGDTPSGT